MKSWLAIPRSRFPAFSFALVLLISLTSLQVCQAMRATYCNVKIEDAVWTSGYDPITCAVSDTHPDSNPILCGKCGSKVVGGGAFFGYQTGAGCGTDVEVDGSVSIEDHGTGALIEQLAEGAWLVSEPQHSGSITVKATVSGFCDCPNTTSITLTAVGTLTVIVPSDEDGGCSVCSSSCSAPTGSAPPLGNGSVNCDSLDFQMSLGPATTARGAGLILLHTNTASADLATSHPLVLYAGPDTTVLPGANGTVRQVKCPQGLVHVKTNSAYEYHIQCYYDSDYNHTLQADGFYATNSGAQPFVVWKVLNPDGASAVNRLYITESRGGVDRTFQFTNTASTLRWDLGRPDGSTRSAWLTQVSSGVTNYIRQTSVGSQVSKKQQDTYQTITGLSYPLLTQTVIGDGTATETTSYLHYSDDPANGAYTNKLKRADYPDGQWMYIVYDSLGRTQTVYSTYGNNPPPSGVPNPPTDQCRVTEYYYSLTTGADGVDDPGTEGQYLARKVIVKVPVGASMVEVSRKLRVVVALNYIMEETCPLPGAGWGAAGNLHEETQYFDIDDARGWKPTTIAHPDGTSTFYDYTSDGALTTIATVGSDSGFPSIYNGQETDTTLNSWGQPTARVTTAYTSGTGVQIENKTYTYTSGGTPIDPLNRSYDLADNLAGLTSQYRYACCGLDTVTDPDGAVTSFDYDQAKRRVAVTHTYGSASIKTTNVLDSAGRTIVTKRIGSDSSVIMLSGTQFDVLGRPMRETNALLGVTMITNTIVSNRRCVTNTYPDGGTRIETYYRDGRLESVSGTAARARQYYFGAEQDGTSGPWREFTLEVKLDSSGGTNEWVQRLFDGVGRPYKTVYSAPTTPYPFSAITYNNGGQKIAERDADGVTNLFAYNSLGELKDMAVDLDWDGAINTAVDRVSRVEKVYVQSGGGKPDRIQITASGWITEGGSSAQRTLSLSEVSADGLRSWRAVYRDQSTPVVTQSRTVYSTGGNRYTTNTAPDSSYSVTAYSYGRVAWTKRFDSLNTQLSSLNFSYDSHGRETSNTDARNGTTTYTFTDADLIATVTTPDPGVVGASAQTTTTFYNTMLQVTNVVQPDSGSVTTEYYFTGDLRRTYGAHTFPTAYSYDYAGRMKTMTNWSTFDPNGAGSGPRVTTWNYDAYRGSLTSKRYPDASTGNPSSTGPDYTYTPGGRLKTRIWARVGTSSQRIVTTYGYGFEGSGDKHGDLASVAYSNDPQSTPSVTYTYDRLGRQQAISRNSITTTLAYNDANEVLTESYSGGILNGLSVTNGFDQFLRRTNLNVLNSSAPFLKTDFGYDEASRMKSLTDNTTGTPNFATYSYLANSPLMSQISFTNGTTRRMMTTKQYDYLNRLTQISSSSSASVSSSFSYQYNDANQRTRCRFADGSLWIYEYDSLGQLINAKRFWPDWTPVAGQRFGYLFDDIGNRISTTAGGDETGANLRSASYSANRLNQYTTRDVPGAVDIMGLALATETVTVNTLSTYRKGEYFRRELAVNNSSSALWTNITVAAAPETSVNGNVFVPKTAEAFTYDLDGNLASDGRWNYTWDAENRLIQMVANTSVGPQQLLKFEYDWKGRRIRKQVWNNTSGTGSPATDLIFVYDSWNLLATLNSSLSTINHFLWGLDLTGSLQGAGGVGGLLAITDSSLGSHFAAFDGNGNLCALTKASDGAASANYEYSPFGELLRATGPMARSNPFRFSTKYQDDETDVSYYGYRYYNAGIGRWLSRDPSIEDGFSPPTTNRKNALEAEQAEDERLLLALSVRLRMTSANRNSLATRLGSEMQRRSSRATRSVEPISAAGRNQNDESDPYAFVSNDPLSGVDLLGLINVTVTTINPCDLVRSVPCNNYCRSTGAVVGICLDVYTVRMLPLPVIFTGWSICTCVHCGSRPAIPPEMI